MSNPRSPYSPLPPSSRPPSTPPLSPLPPSSSPLVIKRSVSDQPPEPATVPPQIPRRHPPQPSTPSISDAAQCREPADQMSQAYRAAMNVANMPSAIFSASEEIAPVVGNNGHRPSNVDQVLTGRRGRAGQRTRGIGRGRGSLRRGTANAMNRRKGPTAGWKTEIATAHTMLSENQFLDSYITQRVRIFVKSALQRLKLELEVKQLIRSRADVMVLMIEEVIQTCLKWLNEFFFLKEIEGMELSVSDMYYLAVLLYIHCSGFSMKKAVPMLESEGGWSINKVVMSFIHNNLLAYTPTERGADEAFAWNPQRDPTVHLGEFERKAYRMSSKVYFSPNHTFCTLDDNLMGKRSQENPVKTISSRKADKEGHSMTAVADAFFRVFLHARFGRRGETRSIAFRKVIADMLETRCERCLEGIVLTYDRGYASEAMVSALIGEGVACLSVMKENTKWSNPFVGRSYFSQDRNDQSFSDCDEEFEAGATTIDRFDRDAEFVVDDSPNARMGVFRAVKICGRGQNSVNITAIAVRHYGSTKHSKLIRFMYAVPSPIYESLQHWIAVSHTWTLNEHLFNYKRSDGRVAIPIQRTEARDWKETLELTTQNMVRFITISQRCADWFTLRQFRVTSTAAAPLLLKCNEYRDYVNLQPSDVPAPSPVEVLESLSKGWFSSCRSSESMKRGTVNEDAVLANFRRQSYIKYVFKVVMCCHKSDLWLGWSVDAVAIFDSSVCKRTSPEDRGEPEPFYAIVEIKTVISNDAVARATRYARPDLTVSQIDTDEFRERVPKEHAAQIVHHCVTFDTTFFFYICASESQILYCVLSACHADLRSIVRNFYGTTVTPALSWAYGNVQTQLLTGNEEMDNAVRSQLPFWTMLNRDVLRNGPFWPVKIFKHASQTVYNKTKGGVDGNAQMRAILRCSTDTLRWEQKVATQVFKSIAVNAWVAWRQLEKEELLESRESFKGLDAYRNALNKIESLADFIFELTLELLTYAEKLDKDFNSIPSEQGKQPENKLKNQQIKRLISKAKGRHRYRLKFFNGADGVTLRLKVKGHDHRTTEVKYCALCGGNNQSRFRGHRSKIMCKLRNVSLCVKVRPTFRRTCWDIWHTIKHLKNRHPKAIQAEESNDKEDDSETDESLKELEAAVRSKTSPRDPRS